MKKIGTTASGSVIVEMSAQEYDALQQLQVGAPPNGKKASISQEAPPKMTHSERATYVAERLRKLGPKKKDGVIRSIEAMFQFGGGIESAEIDRLLTTLQKKKFFTISADGRVGYNNG